MPTHVTGDRHKLSIWHRSDQTVLLHGERDEVDGRVNNYLRPTGGLLTADLLRAVTGIRLQGACASAPPPILARCSPKPLITIESGGRAAGS